jgi:uncharacterized protein (DUF697 family)/uncharacterized tellurite resistance protein B-like protein
MTMHDAERRGIVTLCLMAAFADGERSGAEREHLRRLSQHLGDVVDPEILQRVVYGRLTVRQWADGVTSPDARSLAYEMAVCVCDCDGRVNDKEEAFLEEVRQVLDIERATAARARQEADDLASELPEEAQEPIAAAAEGPVGGASASESRPAAGPVPAPAPSRTTDEAVDRMILQYAVLNGALELLPQSIATMAIVPMQMKMVYRIGGTYGYALDRDHIKEFLGVVGVGMSSQVVESFARKLLGGIARRALGKLGRTVADTAAGSAFSFASTYALGQVAKQYYAGGRTLGAVDLTSLFSRALEQAKSLHPQVARQIQSRAGSLSVSQLLPILRGQL